MGWGWGPGGRPRGVPHPGFSGTPLLPAARLAGLPSARIAPLAPAPALHFFLPSLHSPPLSSLRSLFPSSTNMDSVSRGPSAAAPSLPSRHCQQKRGDTQGQPQTGPRRRAPRAHHILVAHTRHTRTQIGTTNTSTPTPMQRLTPRHLETPHTHRGHAHVLPS